MRLRIKLFNGREFKTLNYQNVNKFKVVHSNLIVYIKEDTYVYTCSISPYTVEEVLSYFNRSTTPRWHSFSVHSTFIEECTV